MLLKPCPRKGLSLTEVLIAMFIMAIGMIAIFTLFPLGAIKIGQALKDDRTSQTAVQADAYMRAYWRQEVLAKLGPTPGTTQVRERFFGAMDRQPLPNLLPGTGYTDARTPSFPVLIDPLGQAVRVNPDNELVAAVASGGNSGLARHRFLNVPPTGAFAVAAMSDDLTFDANGTPTPGLVERQGRYSWAALVQRVVSQPRGTANLTILVFDGRSRLPAITAGPQGYNDEMMLSPSALAVAGERQITLQVPARTADDPVLVREGGWVLDATVLANQSLPVQPAHFYRIVAVTDNGDGTSTLDLETPLNFPLTSASQLYFFAGLSEVFERAPLGPDPNS